MVAGVFSRGLDLSRGPLGERQGGHRELQVLETRCEQANLVAELERLA